MRHGIDVSSNNHPNGAAIDWHRVAASGVEWVAVKLSEGAHYRNAYASDDVHAARAQGLEVVGYHFARPTTNSPETEAANLAGAVKNLGGIDRVYLDIEDGRQLGWKPLARWVAKFLIHADTNYLYWNRDYQHHLTPALHSTAAEQWVAWPGTVDYKPSLGVVQYGQGDVPGIVGPVDLNYVHYPRTPAHKAPTTAPKPAPAPAVHAHPTIRQGDTGPAVRDLQHALTRHGYNLAADGVYGVRTRIVVWNFQVVCHLHADGITGPATWKALG